MVPRHKRQGHRDLHPDRDELRRVVDGLVIVGHRLEIGGLHRQQLFLVDQFQRLADQIDVVAGVADQIGRHGVDGSVRLQLGRRVVDVALQSDGRLVAPAPGAHGILHGCLGILRIGDGDTGLHIFAQRGLHADRSGLVGFEIVDVGRAVERIGRRHHADQDQHDQAHALLAVIGAMREADAGAGEDQQRADPPGRRGIAFRRLVERRIADEKLHRIEQDRRGKEADDRRHQQGYADVGRLRPVDTAGGAAGRRHELVGEADADDRTDHRV
ncbi:hypothetical protein X739_20835 [Mesorhizobium sp. LNHC220B00]|nr:hypothetical protein X739_20835 [Mesorhizobium sp. LNHC220B00]